jgi:hypothetical protein
MKFLLTILLSAAIAYAILALAPFWLKMIVVTALLIQAKK